MAVREQELFGVVLSRYPEEPAPGLQLLLPCGFLFREGEAGGKVQPIDERNEEAFLHIAAMNSHSPVLK